MTSNDIPDIAYFADSTNDGEKAHPHTPGLIPPSFGPAYGVQYRLLRIQRLVSTALGPERDGYELEGCKLDDVTPWPPATGHH